MTILFKWLKNPGSYSKHKEKLRRKNQEQFPNNKFNSRGRSMKNKLKGGDE